MQPRALTSALAVCGLACTAGEPPIANRRSRSPTSDVRAVDWQNRTYQLDDLGPVTVSRGEAVFGANDGDTTGAYHVDPPVFADLDGDGIEDAIILGVRSTGGTGQRSEIRIYTLRRGSIVQLGVIPGGDRGDRGISHVGIARAAVIVDRNVLAEGDPACCASGSRRERWVWAGGEIVEDVFSRRTTKGAPPARRLIPVRGPAP